MINHVKNFWKYWNFLDDIPGVDPLKKAFNKKVTFFEAITESLCQMGLSSFIFKVFGISKTVGGQMLQFFSLSMSITSLTAAFISVSKRLQLNL